MKVKILDIYKLNNKYIYLPININEIGIYGKIDLYDSYYVIEDFIFIIL